MLRSIPDLSSISNLDLQFTIIKRSECVVKFYTYSMNHKSNKSGRTGYFRKIDVFLFFLFQLLCSMHVKQLKTRIRKDHEVSLVDQKD